MATTTDTLIFEFKVNDDASSSFLSIGKQLDSLGKNAVSGFGGLLLDGFTGIFDGIVDIASSAFNSIKDVVGESIDVFGDFEQSMKEIEKAAGGTEKELDALGDSLRKAVIFDLKGTSTVEQLQDIAAMSAKFGVATKDLDTFTVSVAKMADMWGLTVSKTAESAAKLQSQYKLSADQIENIGSVVDGVADSFATSETFLLNFMQRVSGVAQNTGQTIGEMAGLAGIVAVETGMAAQAASSAYQRIFSVMQSNVDEFAKAVGVVPAEMKRLVEEDGAAAFTKLIDYLTQLRDTEGPTAVVAAMKELGISGTNNERMLLGLLGKSEMLNEAQRKGNQYFKEGTRISENFAKSIESQNVGFLQWDSVVKEVYRSIGEALAPTVSAFQDVVANEVVPAVMEFTAWLKESAEASQFFGKELPAFMAELGEYFQVLLEKAVEFGKSIDWSAVLESVSQWLSTVSDKFFEWLPRVVSLAEELFQKLLTLNKTDFHPVVNAIIKIGDMIVTVAEKISVLSEIWGFFWEEMQGEIEAGKVLWEVLKETIMDLWDIVEPMFSSMIQGITDVVENLSEVDSVLDLVGATFKSFGDLAISALKGVIGVVSELTSKLWESTKAVLGLGKEAYGESVFPDMLSWIKKNQVGTEWLTEAIADTTIRMAKLGQKMNEIPPFDPTGREEESGFNQDPNGQGNFGGGGGGFGSPVGGGGGGGQPGLGGAGGFGASRQQGFAKQPGVTINFNGGNILDESSKNRFAQTISERMSTLNSRIVRVS